MTTYRVLVFLFCVQWVANLVWLHRHRPKDGLAEENQILCRIVRRVTEALDGPDGLEEIRMVVAPWRVKAVKK